MEKLKELREKRKTLAAKIKDMAERFNEDKKWADDAERQAWEAVNRDYDSLLKEIETLEKTIEEERQIADRLSQVNNYNERALDQNPPGLEDTPNHRNRSGQEVTEEHRALAMAAWCRSQLDEDLDDRHIEACRRVGLNPQRRHLEFRVGQSHHYRNFHREFRSLHDSRRESLLYESRALSAFAAASGGALVPETFIRSLELNMLAFGGVRQAAETMVTGTGERMAWPTGDDTSNSGEMLGESASIGSSTDPTFGAVYWDAYKFSSKPVLVPYELLEDSFMDLPSVLGQMLGERLGRITATKHTTGTGAGQPKGIVTCASLGVTAASATAIAYDELIDLEHSVDPAYRNGAAYMFHDSILLHLRKLKDGNGAYLWQSGANAGVPDRVNNRPYFISMEMASSVATGAKTVLFGQLNKHKIRRVNSVRLYRLQERYRDNDQDGFIALIREDSNMLDAGTRPVKYLQQA